MSNELLKTYPVSSITSGQYDPRLLEFAIIDSGYVTDYASLMCTPSEIQVWGGEINDQPSLDTLVHGQNHVNESMLSPKDRRDSMVNNDLANWANLLFARKQQMVSYFVYPENTTETELDTYYSAEQREQMTCETVQSVVQDTETVKGSDGCYWMVTTDENGVLQTTELKSFEVF